MVRLSQIVTTLWMFYLTYTRADFHIVYKDIEYPIVDEEYVSMIDAYLTESNAVTVNVTLTKRLPEDANAYGVLLGKSMGEYVVPSGIDVNMNLCDVLDEPIIMGPLLGVLGFRADDCPPSPGIYGSEDYVVPEENFPDDFPPNDYIFILELKQGDRTLLGFKISLEVQS